MATTQVNVSVRYYETDGEGNNTGEAVYEGDYNGSPEVVRSSIIALTQEDSLRGYEPEYTIRGNANQMPSPLAEWWEHIITN